MLSTIRFERRVSFDRRTHIDDVDQTKFIKVLFDEVSELSMTFWRCCGVNVRHGPSNARRRGRQRIVHIRYVCLRDFTYDFAGRRVDTVKVRSD